MGSPTTVLLKSEVWEQVISEHLFLDLANIS